MDIDGKLLEGNSDNFQNYTKIMRWVALKRGKKSKKIQKTILRKL